MFARAAAFGAALAFAGLGVIALVLGGLLVALWFGLVLVMSLFGPVTDPLTEFVAVGFALLFAGACFRTAARWLRS